VRQDGLSIAPQSTGRVYFDSTDGTDAGVWSVDSPGARLGRLTQDIGGFPTIPSDGRFVVLHAIEDRRLIIRQGFGESAVARSDNTALCRRTAPLYGLSAGDTDVSTCLPTVIRFGGTPMSAATKYVFSSPSSCIE